MSAELGALVAGTILGVGALAFVLYPLFFDAGEGESGRRPGPGTASSDADEASAIVALREIEFDRATGKLSESDYAELRAAYAGRALQELRGAREKPGDAVSEPLDPIEARVRAYRMTHRACAKCGIRPEPNAVYCSTCGAFLDRGCPTCSAPVIEPGATFCSTCGTPLGAQQAMA